MNISRSINRSLRLVLSFVKRNSAAENTHSTSTKVGEMVRRALFSTAMKVVCSLPTANSCSSSEKVSILSAGEFVDCYFKKSSS